MRSSVIRIKYLNWNKDKDLLMGLLSGDLYSPSDYYDVAEYVVNNFSADDYGLNTIFREFNRIDEDTFCRLDDNTRSMCVGDLIGVDNTWYIVKPCGFAEIL